MMLLHKKKTLYLIFTKCVNNLKYIELFNGIIEFLLAAKLICKLKW